jgi:hypothetical protein
VELDFSHVPVESTLQVRVDRGSTTRGAAGRITMRGVSASSTIRIVRDDLTHDPPETELLWLTATVLGLVEVSAKEGGAPLPVGADEGCSARLLARGGTVR